VFGPIVISVVAAIYSGLAPRSGGFDPAIDAVLPRVVKLYGLRVGMEAGFGSGVIVSPDGHVLSVYSLLTDARNVRAITADGTVHDAEVLFRDRRLQLALLRLTPPTESDPSPEAAAADDSTSPGFDFFDLSKDSELLPGDWILAAGNAFKVAEGDEPVSIAHGVFSARTRLDARRRVRDFSYRGDVLVIDAITSNPGAPGSAVVNLDGEFVGMIGREVISNLTHTHFNYAIPRDVLLEFYQTALAADVPDADMLAESGRPADPDAGPPTPDRLGLRLSNVGYKRVLPFIEFVRVGSPAHAAGVRKDDLILSINGRSVATVAEVEDRLGSTSASEPVALVLRRNRAIVTARLEKEASE
jgi:serine protease Do